MSSHESQIASIDETIVETMSEIAIPLLRMSLGLTYFWFGALKVAGASPVADLVARAMPLLPKDVAVRGMGVWEMIIGIGLFFRVALRFTLLMFFLQVAGTFSTMLLRPQDVFQKGNPVLLTKDGEFIIKNLVLASAGFAIGSMANRSDEEIEQG